MFEDTSTDVQKIKYSCITKTPVELLMFYQNSNALYSVFPGSPAA